MKSFIKKYTRKSFLVFPLLSMALYSMPSHAQQSLRMQYLDASQLYDNVLMMCSKTAMRFDASAASSPRASSEILNFSLQQIERLELCMYEKGIPVEMSPSGGEVRKKNSRAVLYPKEEILQAIARGDLNVDRIRAVEAQHRLQQSAQQQEPQASDRPGTQAPARQPVTNNQRRMIFVPKNDASSDTPKPIWLPR